MHIPPIPLTATSHSSRANQSHRSAPRAHDDAGGIDEFALAEAGMPRVLAIDALHALLAEFREPLGLVLPHVVVTEHLPPEAGAYAFPSLRLGDWEQEAYIAVRPAALALALGYTVGEIAELPHGFTFDRLPLFHPQQASNHSIDGGWQMRWSRQLSNEEIMVTGRIMSARLGRLVGR